MNKLALFIFTAIYAISYSTAFAPGKNADVLSEQSLLACIICTEQVTNLEYQPCLHGFCKVCCKKMRSLNHFLCPLCRGPMNRHPLASGALGSNNGRGVEVTDESYAEVRERFSANPTIWDRMWENDRKYAEHAKRQEEMCKFYCRKLDEDHKRLLKVITENCLRDRQELEKQHVQYEEHGRRFAIGESEFFERGRIDSLEYSERREEERRQDVCQSKKKCLESAEFEERLAVCQTEFDERLEIESEKKCVEDAKLEKYFAQKRLQIEDAEFSERLEKDQAEFNERLEIKSLECTASFAKNWHLPEEKLAEYFAQERFKLEDAEFLERLEKDQAEFNERLEIKSSECTASFAKNWHLPEEKLAEYFAQKRLQIEDAAFSERLAEDQAEFNERLVIEDAAFAERFAKHRLTTEDVVFTESSEANISSFNEMLARNAEKQEESWRETVRREEEQSVRLKKDLEVSWEKAKAERDAEFRTRVLDPLLKLKKELHDKANESALAPDIRAMKRLCSIIGSGTGRVVSAVVIGAGSVYSFFKKPQDVILTNPPEGAKQSQASE